MRMDPASLIDEQSYHGQNVPSFNLAEFWQLQTNGYAIIAESGVGLGGSGVHFAPDGESISCLPSGNSLAPNDYKKRLKTAGSREMNHNESKARTKLQNSQPPKLDCIHVRARRGQATDSHSLAERARREKISERMQALQDLVPGCSKQIHRKSDGAR